MSNSPHVVMLTVIKNAEDPEIPSHILSVLPGVEVEKN